MNHRPRLVDGRTVEQDLANEAAAIAAVKDCKLCRGRPVAAVGLYIPGPLTQAILKPEGGRPIGMTYGLCESCLADPTAPDRVAALIETPAQLAEYMAWDPIFLPARGHDEPQGQPDAPGRPRLPRPRPGRPAARRKAARRP